MHSNSPISGTGELTPATRRDSRERFITFGLVLCSIVVVASRDVAADVSLRTGQPFHQALEQPFAATWENVSARTIGHRIAAARGVAILLDRRVDPTREQAITAAGESLRAFLERMAEDAGGMAIIVGNTVYLGPLECADKLRTLVHLREQELSGKNSRISPPRRSALAKGSTFAWDDLSCPNELVQRLARQYQLEVDGLDQVPYDLWAEASLPQASATEALSLLLIQWNLTFEWADEGRRIRLTTVPERIGVERSHLPPKGLTAAAAVAQWREEFPSLEARVAGGEVLVQGTLEQHEAIERPRRPARSKSDSSAVTRLKPLKTERYALRMKDQPLRSLMQMLSEAAYGKLTFEFDDAALRRAGVDLDQRVTFEVRNATIEQLLKAKGAKATYGSPTSISLRSPARRVRECSRCAPPTPQHRGCLPAVQVRTCRSAIRSLPRGAHPSGAGAI
jgi:hypothetical protein